MTMSGDLIGWTTERQVGIISRSITPGDGSVTRFADIPLGGAVVREQYAFQTTEINAEYSIAVRIANITGMIDIMV